MIKKLLGGLKRDKDTFMLYAFCNGEVVELERVDDEVFSGGMLGKGVAIEPSEGKLFAPCAGVVEHVFDTQHAINIVSDFGCEILLHIGLDTVTLKGRGFDVKVKEGDRVNKGELLCEFDIGVIKSAGLRATTPMVVCNSGDYSHIEARPRCGIHVGDSILKVTK